MAKHVITGIAELEVLYGTPGKASLEKAGRYRAAWRLSQ